MDLKKLPSPGRGNLFRVSKTSDVKTSETWLIEDGSSRSTYEVIQ